MTESHRSACKSKRLLARPTRDELRRDVWRTDEPRPFVRKEWGWGRTINFGRLVGRRGS